MPPAVPARAPPWSVRRWRAALLLLACAALLLRARYFGNPLIDVDEEWYLLVGDRLLGGAWPYLDLWDRKPVGLFLLYAGIRLLGGAGIWQYQLVAAAFVAATAAVIATIARRIAPPPAALAAGLAYVLALAMSGGQGGQTPVFYNLPMTAAAWLVLGLVAPPGGRTPSAARVRGRGAAAMLLVGIALQIKYSALFEGLFLGLVLLSRAWRRERRAGARSLDAALWIGVALAPTLLAWGVYAAIGEGVTFVYANFTSILARGAVSAGHQWHDARRMVVRLLPFAVPLLLAEGPLRRRAPWRSLPAGRPAHAFLLGWAAAAIVGVLAFGTFFNHYALPLLPPLAIAVAPAFALAPRRLGLALAGLTLVPLAIAFPLDAAKYERRRGTAADAAREAGAIAPRLDGGCLWVFYGEPIYYHLTRSCVPTRFAFPFHLSLAREAPALGIDPLAEARRILATRPPVILDRLSDDDEVNRAVQAEVRAALRRDYRLVYTAARPYGTDPNVDQVWARIPGR